MKTPRTLLLTFLLAITGLSAGAAPDAYLFSSGIPGDSTRSAWENHVVVMGYSHEVISVRDPASGLPTGRRQHGLFKIIKKVTKNSPIFMTKMVNNQTMPTLEIKLVQTLEGSEAVYYTYTLSNASITSIRNWSPNNTDSTASNYPPMEEISFSYQSITWSHADGSEATDSINLER